MRLTGRDIHGNQCQKTLELHDGRRHAITGAPVRWEVCCQCEHGEPGLYCIDQVGTCTCAWCISQRCLVQ